MSCNNRLWSAALIIMVIIALLVGMKVGDDWMSTIHESEDVVAKVDPQNEEQESAVGQTQVQQREPESESEFYFVYVNAGETLSEIALEKMGSTKYIDLIAAYNGIGNPDLIQKGSFLKIPAMKNKKMEYTVRPGDTVIGVAKRFDWLGADPEHIIAQSGLENPDLIYPGQALIISLYMLPPEDANKAREVEEAATGEFSSCTWIRPGSNPFTGDLAGAIQHMTENMTVTARIIENIQAGNGWLVPWIIAESSVHI